MNVEEFIKHISFRSIQPATHSPRLANDDERNATELSNTILPEHDAQMKHRFNELCKIPKMSTFALGAIINKVVADMPEDLSYVNVGIWNGFTFLAGMVGNDNKKCIGIDNWSEFGGPRESFVQRFNSYKSPKHQYYEMDFIEYFKHVHRGKIGFYIYDGKHDYQSQIQGLEIAEPYFAKGCIILIDDTNPNHLHNDPRQSTLDFLAKRSTQYKLLLDAITANPGHPTFWSGVMILQKL